MIATHLQHSEIPAQPGEEERRSRVAQMTKIVRKIEAYVKKGTPPLIFTGDLNQDEHELKAFLAYHQIDWLKRDGTVEGKSTWGGDA